MDRTPLASSSFASFITSFATKPIPVVPFFKGLDSHRRRSVPDPFAATVTQCPSLSRTSNPSFSRHHAPAFCASETTTAASLRLSMPVRSQATGWRKRSSPPRGWRAVARSTRLDLARSVAAELCAREGRNLVAVGVFGSVARGDAREFSDVDLLVVVRRKRGRIRTHLRNGTLVTVLQHTPEDSRREVTGPGPWLNDALGGWRSMRALYDPTRLIARLKARARRPTAAQFRESARRALVETFEDYGKLRNAVAAGDRDEAREMALWFASGAMGSLLDLEGHVLRTGRRAFIEARRHGRPGRLIWKLRYEARSLRALDRVSRELWEALLGRFREKGVSVPGITRAASARSGPSRGR